MTGSFPARAGHFWVTFWMGQDNCFVNFGMSWDVSGSGVVPFSAGFGRASRKSYGEVGKSGFSTMSGSIVPESGHSQISFLAYLWTNDTF